RVAWIDVAMWARTPRPPSRPGALNERRFGLRDRLFLLGMEEERQEHGREQGKAHRHEEELVEVDHMLAAFEDFLGEVIADPAPEEVAEERAESEDQEIE